MEAVSPRHAGRLFPSELFDREESTRNSRFSDFATRLFDKYEIAQQVTAGPSSNQLMVRVPTSEGGRTERYLKQVDAKVRNEVL